MSIKSLGHGTKFLFIVRTTKHGAHTHTYESSIHKATRKHQNLSQDTYIDKHKYTNMQTHPHIPSLKHRHTQRHTMWCPKFQGDIHNQINTQCMQNKLMHTHTNSHRHR